MSEREALLMERFSIRAQECEASDDPDTCRRNALEEVLGELAVAEHDWIPLCPEFPNLKGATCAEIDEALPGYGCVSNRTKHPEWCVLVKDLAENTSSMYLLEHYYHCYSEEKDVNFRVEMAGITEEKCREMLEDPDIDCKCVPHKGDVDSASLKCREPCTKLSWQDAWTVQKYIEKLREAGKKQVEWLEGQEAIASGWYPVTDENLMNRLIDDVAAEQVGYNQDYPLHGRPEHEEYLRSVKCFSRDEMFVAFKSLGDSIRYQLNPLTRDWDLHSPQQRRKLMDELHGHLRVPYKGVFEPREGVPDGDYGDAAMMSLLLNGEAYEKNLAQMDSYTRETLLRLGRMHPLAQERWDIYSDGDPLKDKEGTVFITTPRGGLEMLGIFAYANNMPKHKFPGDFYTPMQEQNVVKLAKEVGELQSMYHDAKKRLLELERLPIAEMDMEERQNAVDAVALTRHDLETAEKAVDLAMEKMNTSAMTWLLDVSHGVRRIFVVDDIVASGEQLTTVLNTLRSHMPKNKIVIYPVTLCSRAQMLPKEVKSSGSYVVDYLEGDRFRDSATWHNVFDDSFIYVRTQGINNWHNAYDYWADRVAFMSDADAKEERERIAASPPTCVFPHSIADGKSDKIVIRVYGDRVWKGKLRLMREKQDT